MNKLEKIGNGEKFAIDGVSNSYQFFIDKGDDEQTKDTYYLRNVYVNHKTCWSSRYPELVGIVNFQQHGFKITVYSGLVFSKVVRYGDCRIIPQEELDKFTKA